MPSNALLRAALVLTATGIVTRINVPPVAAVFKSICPSCASTIFRTIASPSPDPCAFVVKPATRPSEPSSGDHRRPSRAT